MYSVIRSAAARSVASAQMSKSVAGRTSILAFARNYSAHGDDSLSPAEFSSKYVKFFETATDLFEVQRGLNNCFSYDIVPSVEVCEAALKACRRVNDFPTAVRIFEGLQDKCPSKSQYDQYVQALKPVKEELGVLTKEELGL
ncbi:cytochrome c oxidase subunit 6, mitochondrial [Paraphysoderma sedebokerense]|nr:cytochrome c oxidase subunit 6, mitochondrial [Paraphysoderma sedebokerense]